MNMALEELNVQSVFELSKVYEDEISVIKCEQARMAREMDEMERLIDGAD